MSTYGGRAMTRKRRASDPYWTVRGTTRGQDICLVIEAPTATAADCFATKREIEVVVVGEAAPDEIVAAKASGHLWRYTPEPPLKCFGRPVGQFQAATFIICGLATAVLNLHAWRVPLRLHW